MPPPVAGALRTSSSPCPPLQTVRTSWEAAREKKPRGGGTAPSCSESEPSSSSSPAKRSRSSRSALTVALTRAPSSSTASRTHRPPARRAGRDRSAVQRSSPSLACKRATISKDGGRGWAASSASKRAKRAPPSARNETPRRGTSKRGVPGSRRNRPGAPTTGASAVGCTPPIDAMDACSRLRVPPGAHVGRPEREVGKSRDKGARTGSALGPGARVVSVPHVPSSARAAARAPGRTREPRLRAVAAKVWLVGCTSRMDPIGPF
jgi:hypothetical protein